MDLRNRWSTLSAQQIITLLSILGGFAVNTLSNLFPINGLNVGQVSNLLFGAVQIIPANYAFAIWGLIYISLLGFGLYQLQPSSQTIPNLPRSGWLLVAASLAQMAWIYLFDLRLFIWSVVPMLGILLALIGMYLGLEIGKPPVSGKSQISRSQRWLVNYPISLYLGWISVATVVNGAIALYSLGWKGGGISPALWTVGMLLVSGAIALVIALQKRDPVFPLVMVWALVAIAVKQGSDRLILITSLGLAAGLVLAVLGSQLRDTLSPSSAEADKRR